MGVVKQSFPSAGRVSQPVHLILEEFNPDPPPCTPPSWLYKPIMELGRLVGQRTGSTGQSSSCDILYQIRFVVSPEQSLSHGAGSTWRGP